MKSDKLYMVRCYRAGVALDSKPAWMKDKVRWSDIPSLLRELRNFIDEGGEIDITLESA